MSLADDFDQVVVANFIFAQKQKVMCLSVLARTSVKPALCGVVNFGAKYRFDARLGASLIELNYAIHDAVVREGYSGHFKFACSLDQILNSSCSVQEAILGVNMQMNKLSHHLQPPPKEKGEM